MFVLLRLMGCVVWITAVILACVFIGKSVSAFRNEDTTGSKVGWILATIANLIIGAGIGLLFYQVATLIK